MLKLFFLTKLIHIIMEWIFFKKQDKTIKKLITDVFNDETIDKMDNNRMKLIRGGDGDGGECGSDIPLKFVK
jgi:hypothetical protein